MRSIVLAATLVVLMSLLTSCGSAVPAQALKVAAAIAAAESVQAVRPVVPVPQPSTPVPEVTPAPAPPPGLAAGLLNAPIAEVDGVPIFGIDFQKRVRFEKAAMEKQLVRFQQLEEQFGNQGYFQAQISELEATLASPLSLGTLTLDTMIEDRVLAREAASRGISVSEEEVHQALNEEIANERDLVTAAQATATATAAAAATATAAAWTPTPTATADPNGANAIVATLVEPPPAAVITGTLLAEGMASLEKDLAATSGLSLDEYREIVRSRLLRQKVFAAIGQEMVTGTEEQVHVRHILVGVGAPDPGTSGSAEGAPDTHGPYPDAEALALANELRSRILAGEDFGDLARTYSYDTGSAAYGGDLGWFGKGVMVLPFEEAAFSLPAGQVSEPVRTDFGYHLVEVIEKDPARPKDEARLQQERAETWKAWMQEQIAGDRVKRAKNLLDFMPVGVSGETGTAGGAGDGTTDGTVPVAVQEPDVPPDWIDGTSLGDPNAPLEVQVWADYLCPSCQVFAATVEPQLIKKYVKPGKVRLTLHYFPLQQHEPGGTTAALAAACAGAQNRFWPYHWYLMAMTKQGGQAAAAYEALATYARTVGLDEGAFQSCMVKQDQAELVTASVTQAYALNLQFVPAVIVGDTLLQDSTFDSVQAEIDRQLQLPISP